MLFFHIIIIIIIIITVCVILLRYKAFRRLQACAYCELMSTNRSKRKTSYLCIVVKMYRIRSLYILRISIEA